MSLREEILEVSKELLIKDGFRKMSMRRIAKRANVTATSIYLHFENKDDLLLALIDESIENLKLALFNVVDFSKERIQQLEDLARAYLEFALNHPQEYEIIYMVKPEEMPKYPKKKFSEIRSVFELVAGILKEGSRNEHIEVDNPLISVYSIWAQLHGVVTVILNKRLDTRIPQNQFIDQAIENIIEGVMKQKNPA